MKGDKGGSVDLPEWFLDELLNLPASDIRLLVILLKHSHQALAAQGVPAYKAALSASSLAREAKVSRAGAYRGLAHLEEIGLIEVHRSWKSREPTAFLIPWVRHPQEVSRQQRGPPVSPVRQRHTNKQLDRLKIETPLNNPGGGDDKEITVSKFLAPSSMGEESEKGGVKSSPLGLEAELQTIGELHPLVLLGRYGPERVEAALRHLKARPRDSIKNPPGWLRYQLESRADFTGDPPQHESWGGKVQRKMCPHLHGQPCRVPGVQPDKCKLEDCPNEQLKRLIRSGAGQPG